MGSETALQTVRRRRRELLFRRDRIALLLRTGMLALGLWVAFSQVFLLHRNQGLGMFPAVKDGDLVLAYRLQQEYRKGDLVVYRREDRLHMGRVVACGGDVIRMDDEGGLSVNGSSQSGEILYPTFPREGSTYPQRIPEGRVFLLGDYRTQARDSRDWGPVPLEDIQGKVITLVRRRGL